jgi:hypothetical protein
MPGRATRGMVPAATRRQIGMPVETATLGMLPVATCCLALVALAAAGAAPASAIAQVMTIFASTTPSCRVPRFVVPRCRPAACDGLRFRKRRRTRTDHGRGGTPTIRLVRVMDTAAR